MHATVSVELPGGLWHRGARFSVASVRALVGADEEALLEPATSAAHRTSMLLARCVTLAGLPADGPEDPIRSLAVGDREALLWHVWRLAFGPTIGAVVECTTCSEKLDVTLDIADVLHPGYGWWAERYVEDMAGHGVVFRLPTGADVEAVAGQALIDPTAAGRELLGRCVIAVDGSPPPMPLPDELGDGVADRMAELDPQTETILGVVCPRCANTTPVMLDAADYFFEVLAQRSDFLYEQVHSLAWYYHWSEHDILAMTPSRRARYLDLIERAHAAEARP